MSEQTTDFFDEVGGEGAGAPGAVLKAPGDWVHGKITKMFKRGFVPYNNRKTREVEKNNDGTDRMELVIVLQTTFRNWENVISVPKVDYKDPNSAEKPPSDDDGLRVVYVPERSNIQFKIADAVREARASNPNAPFGVGGTLGVKVVDLEDTGQGNPMKVHEAAYTAPGEGDSFVESAPAAQQAAPAQEAAPAAPPASPAPAQGDPWATPAQSQSAPPPF